MNRGSTIIEGTKQRAIKDRQFEKPIDQIKRDLRLSQEQSPFSPFQVFNLTFPYKRAEPQELTVISWILPQREITKADNRKETRYPSERWARARIYGEDANAILRQHVVEGLAQKGIAGLAPQLSSYWSRQISANSVLPSPGQNVTPHTRAVWGPSGSVTV